MKTLLKKITALFLMLCIMLSSVPVFAEEGAVIKGGTASGYAGSTVTLNFTAENLKNLAALDMDIYYDPAVLKVSTATSTGFSGASVDVNTSTEGCVSVSMASAKGFSGSLTVLTVKFEISSTANPGDYDVFVAIGDAYDANRESVNVLRKNGKITVLERVQSVPTASFYCSVSDNSIEQGDETTLTYYSYSLYNLASGVFEFTYDPELFEFVEFGIYTSMQTPDAVYSVNSDRAGYVKVAYVSSTAIKTGNLFFIKLKAIKDSDATATVEMTPSSLYAQDLSPINGSKRTSSVTITKKYVEPEPEDHPDFWVELPEKIVEGKEFEALVKIGDSGVAAGDFTIGYNTEDFLCVSVSASDEVYADGGSVTINPGYANGKIKFSFINVDGISKSQSLLVIKFVPIRTGAYSSEITTAGIAIYDAKYNPVNMDYITSNVTVAEKKIERIEIVKLPEKTEYVTGSEIVVAGGRIRTIYDNGFSEEIDMEQEMVLEFDGGSSGQKTVVLIYEGATTEFDVTVLERLKCGDINRDGKVNTIDANYARRYAAGLLTLDEAQKLAGDVNLDGEVNVMDSAIIRRYVVKYITSLPYLKET